MADPVNDTTVLLVRVVVDGMAVVAVWRFNPDTAWFPVTVCEAAAPLDTTVTVSGETVPTMAGRDSGDLDVDVLGDTGCFPKDQSCDDGWPFRDLARVAADDQPGLVIHVGDYDYRGTPSRRADGDPRIYDGCVPGADSF